jgi:hypothetical protein
LPADRTCTGSAEPYLFPGSVSISIDSGNLAVGQLEKSSPRRLKPQRHCWTYVRAKARTLRTAPLPATSFILLLVVVLERARSTGGEDQLYALESCETWTGGESRRLAVVKSPSLSHRRRGKSADGNNLENTLDDGLNRPRYAGANLGHPSDFPARETWATRHWNPVRRGLAENPEDWQRSSHRHYLTGEEGRVRMETTWKRHWTTA